MRLKYKKKGNRHNHRQKFSASRRVESMPSIKKKSSRKIFVKLDNAPYVYRDAGSDFSILLSHYRYRDVFSQPLEVESLKLLEKSRSILTSKKIAKNFITRLDLSNHLIVSVDGEDAKDFDDAISLKKLDPTDDAIIKRKDKSTALYELGVHIADVSHYLKKDSPLDLEAKRRATSIYFPHSVLPMLPFTLSNDLCSLIEGKHRLTYSCIMKIDATGNILDYAFQESIVQVRRRCTYVEVDKVLDGKLNLGSELNNFFLEARLLQKILMQKRLNEGGLDFDLEDENVVLMDKKSSELVKEVRLKKRFVSERIIEDFMLLANQCAAMSMHKLGVGMFRNHDGPEMEKLQEINRLITMRGYTLPSHGSINPVLLHERKKKKSIEEEHLKENLTQKNRGKIQNKYQIFLSKVENGIHKRFFSKQILFSMMQARYAEKNLGHYGLGFVYYCHFTSPIRRYPDVIVHRLLKEIFADRFSIPALTKAKIDKSKFTSAIYTRSELKKLGLHCSVEERRAEACEREYKKLKIIRYLDSLSSAKVEFDGVVTGMNERGLFVRDNKTGIEGMIEASSLAEEVFFDADKFVFKNYSGRVRYEIGQVVRMHIRSLNFKKLLIDFRLIDRTTDNQR